MTKEELYQSIAYPNNVSISNVSITNYLNDFFETNVCIPKGENRHQCADILHEIAENPDKELQMQHKSNVYDWDTLDLYKNYVFRIKPSEPVYEWQWYSIINGYVDDTTDAWEYNRWFTKDEISKYGTNWYKFEETKRERR